MSSAVPETVEQGENQPQPAAQEAEKPQDEDVSENAATDFPRFSELTQARRERKPVPSAQNKEAAALREQAQAKAQDGGGSGPSWTSSTITLSTSGLFHVGRRVRRLTLLRTKQWKPASERLLRSGRHGLRPVSGENRLGA